MVTTKYTTEAFLDDKLNRKEFASHLKNILLNTDLNIFSVVALWGCGKTYFIQNLIKQWKIILLIYSTTLESVIL